MPLIPISEIKSLSSEALSKKYSRSDVQETLAVLQGQSFSPSTGSAIHPSRQTSGGFDPFPRIERPFTPSPYDPQADDNLSRFGGNVAKSGVNFLAGMADMALNPLDTVSDLSEAGLSGIGQGLKDRFGSVDALKRTAFEDPVGLAADVVPLGGGIARGMTRLGGTTGRTANVVANAADAINPIKRTGQAIAKTARGPGFLQDITTKSMTGVDLGKIQKFKDTVFHGNRADRKLARDVIRQNAPADLGAQEVRSAAQVLRKQRSADIKAAKEALQVDTIPFDRQHIIDDVLTRLLDPQTGELKAFRIQSEIKGNRIKLSAEQGGNIAGENGLKHVQKTLDLLVDQVSDPARSNLGSVWAVREFIDGKLAKVQRAPSTEAVLTSIREKLQNTINVHGPEAFKAMSTKYHEQSKFLETFEKELGVTRRAKDSTISKNLSNALNQKSDVGRAVLREVQDELVRLNPKAGRAMETIGAATELGDMAPSGIVGQGIIAGGIIGGGLAGGLTGALGGLAVIPFTFPRFMGEIMAAQGMSYQTIRPVLELVERLNKVPKIKAMMGQGFNLGQAIERAEEESNRLNVLTRMPKTSAFPTGF